MVRSEVAFATTDGKVRPLRSASVVAGKRGDRARWLEPYGDAARWRAEMWGAIVALHGRYPRALGALKDGWWTDESHVEILSALVEWRAEIDESAEDPREELAFQTQLAGYVQTLRQEGGGVTKAWKPGPPPDDW